MRWPVLLLVLAAAAVSAQAPAPGDLVLNEVMYDPPAPQPSGNEWVEILNVTGGPLDLGGLVLTDGGATSAPVGGGTTLAAGGYAVLARDPAAFAAAYPGVPVIGLSGFPSLNNTGDRPALVLGATEIDAVPYLPSWGGTDASLERRDPLGPSTSAGNFGTSTAPAGGTPGAQNSIFQPDVTGPVLTGATATPDGRAVIVTLDEPADPASVTAAAFSVSGVGVTVAVYDSSSPAVVLTLDAPLPAGTSTVTATGLRDPRGNTTATSSTTVTFTPDTVAPGIARVTARSPSVLAVTFSEPVRPASATNPGAYSVDGGTVASVDVVDGDAGSVRSVDLTLAAPLAQPALYTLVVTSLTDVAGNVADRAEARVFVGTPDTPGPGDLVVTEVMYDPALGSAGEYVEVYNASASGVFALDRVTIDDGDGDGDPFASTPAVLVPGAYLAVVRDLAGFRQTFPQADAVSGGGAISLSNSGEAVVLRAGGAVLDSVFYQPSWHRVELDDATGISLERRDPAGPSNDADNWSSSLDEQGGTPSAPNSVSVSGTPVERETALTVTSPFAPTRGEAARITYTLSTEAALVRARIYDGGGRPVREIEAGRLSGATATITWDGTDDDRRPARAGIYVVLVEAVDVQGGTTEALRGVVVLARP